PRVTAIAWRNARTLMKPIRNVRKIAAKANHATTIGRLDPEYHHKRSAKNTELIRPLTRPMAASNLACHAGSSEASARDSWLSGGGTSVPRYSASESGNEMDAAAATDDAGAPSATATAYVST